MTDSSRMASVVGGSAVVIGNIHGSGDLEVRGRIQGSIEITGRVLISETGLVLGSIEATHIHVSGQVRGDLAAEDGVLIAAQGRVEGNISAPRVGIEAGARVRGILRTGDEITEEERTAAPASPAAQSLPQAENSAPAEVKFLPPEEKRPKRESEGKKPRKPRRTSKDSAAAPSSETEIKRPVPSADSEPVSRQKTTKARVPRAKKPGPKKTLRSTRNSPDENRDSDKGNQQPEGAKQDGLGSAATSTRRTKPESPPASNQPRKRGPPKMPTFVKGTKTHKRA